MKSIGEQLQAVPKTISLLEEKVHKAQVSKATLDKLQDGLDALDSRIENQGYTASKEEMGHMYELQALLDYARGDLKRARAFINEALAASPDIVFVSEIANELSDVATKPGVQFTDTPIPEYLTVSSFRLCLLTFVTFGLYPVYWFYKNWKAIQVATGKRQHPILSAMFAPIAAYDLFSKVRGSMKELGNETKVGAGGAAWSYFFLNIFTLGTLTFIPLLIMQGHMNTIKKKAFGDSKIREGTSVGEVLFIILALLYAVLIIFGGIAQEDYSGTSGLSPDVAAKKLTVDSLTTQYEECSDKLIALQSTLDTDNRLEVDDYNDKYRDCEDIRLQQNQAADEYNQMIAQ